MQIFATVAETATLGNQSGASFINKNTSDRMPSAAVSATVWNIAAM